MTHATNILPRTIPEPSTPVGLTNILNTLTFNQGKGRERYRTLSSDATEFYELTFVMNGAQVQTFLTFYNGTLNYGTRALFLTLGQQNHSGYFTNPYTLTMLTPTAEWWTLSISYQAYYTTAVLTPEEESAALDHVCQAIDNLDTCENDYRARLTSFTAIPTSP